MNDRLERDITEALSRWATEPRPVEWCRTQLELYNTMVDILQAENDGLRWRVVAVGSLALVLGIAIGAAVMAAFSVGR